MNTTRSTRRLAVSHLVALAVLTCLNCHPAGAAEPREQFLDPPLKFRARPLWFWNEAAVTPAGVEAQMQGCRDQCGYGGLAPFGKQFTPKYLSEEYFDVYGAAVHSTR